MFLAWLVNMTSLNPQMKLVFAMDQNKILFWALAGPEKEKPLSRLAAVYI